jgi:DNA-binding MarR family transcriptional regulator
MKTESASVASRQPAGTREAPTPASRNHAISAGKRETAAHAILLRRVPAALARRFAQICMAVSAADAAPLGLTPIQYAALAYLRDQTGDLEFEQGMLAEGLGIDRNHMSLAIDALEARGLVRRRVNPADRRSRLCSLTAAGRTLRDATARAAFDNQMHILDPLSPAERGLLLDLLVRVIEGNLALARPGAGRRPRRKTRQPVTGEET